MKITGTVTLQQWQELVNSSEDRSTFAYRRLYSRMPDIAYILEDHGFVEMKYRMSGFGNTIDSVSGFLSSGKYYSRSDGLYFFKCYSRGYDMYSKEIDKLGFRKKIESRGGFSSFTDAIQYIIRNQQRLMDLSDAYSMFLRATSEKENAKAIGFLNGGSHVNIRSNLRKNNFLRIFRFDTWDSYTSWKRGDHMDWYQNIDVTVKYRLLVLDVFLVNDSYVQSLLPEDTNTEGFYLLDDYSVPNRGKYSCIYDIPESISFLEKYDIEKHLKIIGPSK